PGSSAGRGPPSARPRRRRSRTVLDPLQPDLPPERDELARAAGVVDAFADQVVEDDAGALHVEHPPGLLVQAALHPGAHPRGPAAVAGHLLLEAEPPVEQVGVERVLDLRLGLDPDQLARLEVELAGGRGPPGPPLDEPPAQPA